MLYKLSINQEYEVEADDEIDAKIEVIENIMSSGGYDFVVSIVNQGS